MITGRRAGLWEVWFAGGNEPLLARSVVNSGGLAAQALATRTEGLSDGCIPALHLDKGSKGAQAYLALAGEMLRRGEAAHPAEALTATGAVDG